jgi:hypothetical protein
MLKIAYLFSDVNRFFAVTFQECGTIPQRTVQDENRRAFMPHHIKPTGEVIAYYRRKRKYDTQVKFAIAAGVTLRTVQEWEVSIMIHDHNRRIFLGKMLRILPALLGLDWRLVSYEDNTGEHMKKYFIPFLRVCFLCDKKVRQPAAIFAELPPHQHGQSPHRGNPR